MKKIILCSLAVLALTTTQAQRKKKGNDFKTEMTTHYQTYFKTMLANGDVNGAIAGLNHLIILSPTQGKKDTLGALYLQDKKPFLAIKSIGDSESDLALRTKASAFKGLNNLKKAIEVYEKIVAKSKNVLDVYELAQLQFGLQRFSEAKSSIQFGLQNAKNEKVKIFIKKNSYIETPIQAAFYNILGLISYNLDKTNTEQAVSFFDKALEIDGEFVLALENKKSITEKK